MAEENRNESNAIVSVLGDILLELQGHRQIFDRGFNAVLDRLEKIDNRLESVEKNGKQTNLRLRHAYRTNCKLCRS